MSESNQIVMDALMKLHEKHSYALKLLTENVGKGNEEGFAFARGKEAGLREAIGILDEMLSSLRAIKKATGE